MTVIGAVLRRCPAPVATGAAGVALLALLAYDVSRDVISRPFAEWTE